MVPFLVLIHNLMYVSLDVTVEGTRTGPMDGTEHHKRSEMLPMSIRTLEFL